MQWIRNLITPKTKWFCLLHPHRLPHEVSLLPHPISYPPPKPASIPIALLRPLRLPHEATTQSASQSSSSPRTHEPQGFEPTNQSHEPRIRNVEVRVPGNEGEKRNEEAPRSNLTKNIKRKHHAENLGGPEQWKKAGGREEGK
ncbi:hypothetical protein CIPAW_01G117500 [Carya illinoinensis]|uniref:Uncharacterized protein n=1 Tax=Carya illinoinensis TaxID=32201 RepID=A0A8T1RNM7_CARIL|nr:hypothetical protein CIPAW_01G117500 [Carya illinoinensis]KAG6731136.1 hypothetical protein I3842_01G115300 [Carya illinoinensis]